MDPDLSIGVDGIFTFWGQLPPSEFGFVVGPDGLEGITDGVAAKGQTVPRPGAHGDFELPTYLDSRIVSISGTCLAESPQDLKQWGEAFTGLLVGRVGKITMDHLGDVRWGRAGLAPGTQKKFKVHGVDSLSADFHIQLKFSNPRFFGDSKTFGSGEFAYHYGNFASAPVHTVTGNMPGGYAIDGPNFKQFRVLAPLVPGHPHTVDMNTGHLSIDGVVVFGFVQRADTWAIPGGGQVIHYLTPITTGTGTIASVVPSVYV